MQTANYPHIRMRVISRVDDFTPQAEDLPLFKPLFLIMSSKGRVGVPTFKRNIVECKDEYGAETFDRFSKYYSNESFGIEKNFEQNAGAFIVRVASENAKRSSCVLLAHVTKDVQVTQYQKDSTGKRIVDEETGNWIPEVDGTNEVVKHSGTRIKFTTRPLGEGEELDEVEYQTVSEGGVETTIYPIFVFENVSHGVHGDRTGFSLFYDYNADNEDMESRMGSLMFGFSAAEKDYKTDIVSLINTTYLQKKVDFCFDPDALNPATRVRMGFEDIIEDRYSEGLPFNIHPYTDHIRTICEDIMLHESDFRDFETAWMINPLTGRDQEGLHYDTLEFSSESEVTFDDEYVIYLTGGDDGDTSREAFNALVAEYLKGDVFPEIRDPYLYPYTNIIDLGFSLDTKYALIDTLSMREEPILTLSTWIDGEKPNDAATEMAILMDLYAKARLHPECAIEGTDALRVEIVPQGGTPINGGPRGTVPQTIERLVHFTKHYSTPIISGVIGGSDDTQLTVLKNIQPTFTSGTVKEMMKTYGANYSQPYTMTRKFFFPSITTIYDNLASPLRDMSFAAALMHCKYKARDVWSRTTGMEVPVEHLAATVENQLKGYMDRMLNGRYEYTLHCYQTEEEKRQGGILHCAVTILDDPNVDKLRVDFICKRTES